MRVSPRLTPGARARALGKGLAERCLRERQDREKATWNLAEEFVTGWKAEVHWWRGMRALASSWVGA